MRIDVSLEILQDCAERHLDFMREYRLSGDIKYLKGFVQDVIHEAIPDEKSADEIMQEFREDVTDNELKALFCIIQEIGEEGNISIVKMIQKTPHSRPVYTSLLSKMEKHKIAEVKNQGVKGTYIKLLCSSEGLNESLGIDLKSMLAGVLGAKMLGGKGDVTVNVEPNNE